MWFSIKTLEQVGLKSIILFFYAPDLSGVFEQWMKQTRKLLKTMNLDHIRWVEQKRCNSERELLNFLNRIEARGAEGFDAEETRFTIQAWTLSEPAQS